MPIFGSFLGPSQEKSTYLGTGVPEPVHCLPMSDILQSQIAPDHSWGARMSVLTSVVDQSWKVSSEGDEWCLKPIETILNPYATASNSNTVSLVLPKQDPSTCFSRFPLDDRVHDLCEVAERHENRPEEPMMRVIGGRHRDDSSSYFALFDPAPSKYCKGRRPDSLCAIGMSEQEYRTMFSVPSKTTPAAVSQSMLRKKARSEFHTFPDAGSFLADALDRIDKAYCDHQASNRATASRVSVPQSAPTQVSTASQQSGPVSPIQPSLLD